MSEHDQELTREANRLFQAGQFAEAEAQFARMLSEEPDNHQVLLMMGLCRHARGDRQGALEHMRRSAESAPQFPEAHYQIGRLLLEDGQPDAAREAFNQALNLNPNHIHARCLSGVISLRKDELDRALQELRAALRIGGEKHVPTLAALAMVHLRRDELQEAHRFATQAVKTDSEHAGAQHAMGRVYLAQGHVAFAEQCMRNALDKHPGNPELSAGLATVLSADGRHGEALEHYAQAMRSGFASPALVLEMSDAMERAGQPGEAVRLLAAAAGRWPDDAALAMAHAGALRRAGDPEAALRIMDALDPGVAGRPDARLERAEIELALDRPEAAAEHLRGLENTFGGDTGRRARLLSARLQESASRCRQLLEPLIAEGDGRAASLLAERLEAEGERNAAIDHLERFLDSHRTGAEQEDLDRLLGLLLDRAGRHEEASGHLGAEGRRPAPVPGAIFRSMESGWLRSCLDWTGNIADVDPPDDGRPAPAIILGWPGSGRELILAALVGHPEVALMNPGGLGRRREALDFVTEIGHVEVVNDLRLRGARKRFLRGEPDGPVLLDPAPWEIGTLPALSRLFPGLKVLVPFTTPQDLELFWRLSGYAEIPRLKKGYQAERAAFEHLVDRLPIRVLPVRRGQLVSEPAVALAGICERLGIEPDPGMADRLQAAAAGQPFRPDGHWRHYRGLLGATDTD